MKKKLVVIVCALAFSLSSLAQNQVNYIIEGGYALMANFGPSPALRQPINGGQIDFPWIIALPPCRSSDSNPDSAIGSLATIPRRTA